MAILTDDAFLRVRVRVRVPDPYAGLKGAEYINARGLSPRPNRSHTEACPHCALQEMLPAVQAICSSFERRSHDTAEQPAWNNLDDESVLALLDGPTITGD
jgi:hypothetical protein